MESGEDGNDGVGSERLTELIEAFRAFVGAQLVGVCDATGNDLATAVADTDGADTHGDATLRAAAARAAQQALCAKDPAAGFEPDDAMTVTRASTGHTLAATAICGGQGPSGAVCIAVPADLAAQPARVESMVDMLRRVLALACSSDTPRTVQRRHLDELVTSLASKLMPVRRETLATAIADTLAQLQEFFGVDTVFLRRNDHDRGISALIDEYPRREDVPDPDPLGEVAFEANSVFAATRDLQAPFVQRPPTSEDSYQRRVQAASGIDEVSVAMAPLLSERTEGVLGLVRFGDRSWSDDETSALQAIASLLTQLWGRVAAEDQLHHQAWYDQLTCLRNRHALFAELDRRRAETTGPLGVAFLDLDDHKDVNDVLGHQVGDELLRTVAARLRTTSRHGDFPARFGGDEFVVLLDGPMDEMGAYAATERLVGVVSEPMTIAGHELQRTVSAGVVVASDPATSADELLGQADAALYRAKALGHNQVVVFDESLQAAARERFSTEVLLRRAISEEQLELHYQPEIELRTGKLLAVEALVRWRHPTQGLLGADTFVQVAERTGMILDLGEWVLEAAARQATEWVRRRPELDFATRINVSPLQLRNRGLATAVASAVTDRPLQHRLTLEITEHAVMQDVDQARTLLGEVRDLGVGIALDDFGTGYSSLAQLKHLPLDHLKVDRAFVAGLGNECRDRLVLEAISRLAAAFDLELIAEGVEAPTHVDHLLAIGCHRAQGYLLSYPLPPDELERVLLAGGLDMGRIHGDGAQASQPDDDATMSRQAAAPSLPGSLSSGQQRG
jgi:diguanylate cyclase (GGDEF)-like protein